MAMKGPKNMRIEKNVEEMSRTWEARDMVRSWAGTGPVTMEKIEGVRVYTRADGAVAELLPWSKKGWILLKGPSLLYPTEKDILQKRIS